MRKHAFGYFLAASLFAAVLTAAEKAEAFCHECGIPAFGSLYLAWPAYPHGNLPGITSLYYGYAPGYYDYPPPHSARAGRVVVVRSVSNRRLVPPAAFDPASKSARR